MLDCVERTHPLLPLLSLSFLINDLSLLDRVDLGDGNRVVIELIAIIAAYGGVSAHACSIAVRCEVGKGGHY